MAGAAFAELTTVYRYVDEEGVVHFSDTPGPGSEKLEVQHVESYPAGRPPVTRFGSRDRRQPRQEAGGLGIRIVSPEPDTVLQANGGNIDVSIATKFPDPSPDLDGFSVVVYLDGKAVSRGGGAGGGFSLSEVHRGSHTVRAELLQGNTSKASSTPVTFHVRQPSTLLSPRKSQPTPPLPRPTPRNDR